MRKERTLFFIGIWVVLLPFLGFPNSIRQWLFVISGLAILYLAYLFRQEVKARIQALKLEKEIQTMDAFIDNINDL